MPKVRDESFKHKLRIHIAGQDEIWWHETLTSIVEVFGPPGKRYEYHSTEKHFDLYFRTKKDVAICKMLLSEKL